MVSGFSPMVGEAAWSDDGAMAADGLAVLVLAVFTLLLVLEEA